jgi:hypothetical protein
MTLRPKLTYDKSPGVPCPPDQVLRLVVEGVVDGDRPPRSAPIGRVLEIGVSPFWIGFNRGCFPGRPNDLILEDAGLSRNSCSFTLDEGRWYAKDHAGTTPLLVNGVVADWTPVRPGDEVCIGNLRCRAYEPKSRPE